MTSDDLPLVTKLLQLAKAGDGEAERALFARLDERFRTIAGRYVGSEAARDVAQEAASVIAQKYKTEEIRSSFEAWAHGVLRFTIRHHLHRRALQDRREAPLLDSDGSGGGDAVDPHLLQALRVCLKAVMARSRAYGRALVLSYQGYKVAEICRRLVMPPERYYVVLSRARSHLRDCLRGSGDL